MPAQKSEVSTKSPERGGRREALQNARLLMLKWQVFDVAMGKYMAGKRDKPPDWQAFVKKFREGDVGEMDADWQAFVKKFREEMDAG